MLRLQKKQSKTFKLLFGPIEKGLDALDTGYARMLNWAVRHRPIVIFGCIVFFVVSLFCAKSIGTEFFPAQDNARIAVQLELPIGTRKELAQEVSEKLTNQWLNKYKGVMTVCNYTVGQADSDNTWASMQDNGSHRRPLDRRQVRRRCRSAQAGCTRYRHDRRRPCACRH